MQASTVVGYNTTTIQGTDAASNINLYLLGIQFKSVSGSDDQISLKDAIDMSNVPAFAGKWKDRGKNNNSATIQVWNGIGFDSYYWVAPACSGAAANCWVGSSGSQGAGSDIGATTFLKAGDSVWFSAKILGTESATITFAGAVKTEDSATVVFGAQPLSMGTNPYPMTYNIKDIIPSCAAFTGKWKDRGKGTNSASIQTWNGVGFVSYYWVAPACSGLTKDAWVGSTGSQGDGCETLDTLAAGTGFWFKNVSGEAGTLTFTYKAN